MRRFGLARRLLSSLGGVQPPDAGRVVAAANTVKGLVLNRTTAAFAAGVTLSAPMLTGEDFFEHKFVTTKDPDAVVDFYSSIAMPACHQARMLQHPRPGPHETLLHNCCSSPTAVADKQRLQRHDPPSHLPSSS